MNSRSLKTLPAQVVLASVLGLTTALTTQATVLDDFNAAQRSGWVDSDPAHLPSQVLPQKGGVQANGVFTFTMPPLGQPYFMSSTKTSPTFELKEGRSIEYRVDMVSGLGTDSYAVLGFMPTANGPDSLAGYGIAKSETDVLITKGISKYFIDDDSAPVKNSNISLVLNLSVKNGNVYIVGQVLDKDDNNKVIWERTFVDTPNADILGTGQDNPPAPYITTGNFVLYLYADGGMDPAGYQVVLDNAEYFVTDSVVVDDFNAAQRSGWQDSNPGGFPLPGGQQANGVFTFGLPAVGQDYFIASAKTTKNIKLEEGTRHEISVDMISGLGNDSFAVLAFIPTATGPNSLAGYGMAKSASDVLITKGINKYFIDDDTAPVKNDNINLTLTVTVRGGNVTLRGRVLDKDNNNQVIWERTFVDTPAADILGTGVDDPPTPFIDLTGNLVLYLYGQNGTDPNGYQVVFDNLVLAEPPSGTNSAPIVSSITPVNGAAFLSAPVSLSFSVLDDKPLPDTGFSVLLNGVAYTTANGLTLSGANTNRTVTLAAGTGANTNYTVQIIVRDSDTASVTNITYFDTFAASNPMIEIENYNFNGGQYYNDPTPTPEFAQAPNSYTDQVGTEGIDFHDTRTAPNTGDTMYRTLDPVRMQHSLDQVRPQYDANAGIYGYDVGDFAADEWLNYTKDFAPGNYEVYLRQSIVGFPQADSLLELVTSDPAQPNQTVTVLGSFLGKLSGFTFRNTPLTDGSGLNKAVLRLSGKTTLRLHQVTADTTSASRYQNYLIFIPVAGSSVQRAVVASLQPAPDSTTTTVSPVVAAEIQNRDTSVVTSSIELTVNAQKVTPTIETLATGAKVTWPMNPLPASGALNTATLSFKDNQGTNQTTTWSFTITYATLDAANARPTPGPDRGMKVRVVQAPEGSNLENSLDRAEQQLQPNSPIPVAMETNEVVQIMSMTRSDAPFNGFDDYTAIPGVDGSIGYDDFTVEAQMWLELPAGIYEFGVTTDDGYKLSSGTNPSAKEPILAFHNDGTANNERVSFVVTTSGLYPFRFLWYQRGGGAQGQWYSVNRTTGERTLINNPNSPAAIKAYLTASLPAVRVQSATTVSGTYSDDSTAIVDAAAKRITVPLNGPTRYYRLAADTALKIKSSTIQGSNFVMTYE